MIENTAFTSSCKENPFYFKPYFVSFQAAYLNGKHLPAKPLSLNFEIGDNLDGYRSLFTATSKLFEIKKLELLERST